MNRRLYKVACPKCGVGAGEHCRTQKTNRVTDTHQARIDQERRYQRHRRFMGVTTEENR